MLFQNIEGSIIAKATKDTSKNLDSYAAVLASICHEYIEFGTEAFQDNKFRCIMITHGDQLLAVRPIWKEQETASDAADSPEEQKRLKLESDMQSS